MTEALAQYTTNTTLANIETIGQASEAITKAKLIAQVYDAQGKHYEAQLARLYYMQAARIAGQMVAALSRDPGGANSCDVARVTELQQAAEDAGVSRFVLRTWEKLAEIPDETFTAYLDDPVYQWGEYTINGAIRYGSKRRDGVYTPESMAKVILHWVKRFKREHPRFTQVLMSQIIEVLR